MPNMGLIYCEYCEEVREPQPIPNSEFVHPACNPISGHLNLGFMFQKFAKDQLASDLHRNSHVMTAMPGSRMFNIRWHTQHGRILVA
jgi:hypothetical protein